MDMSPSDYLDKIAPKAPKKQPFGLNLRSVLIVGGALTALVIILSIVVNALAPDSRSSWQRLSLKLAATDEIASVAGVSIKNSQLRSLNSEARLYVSNTQRDLGEIFTTQEVNGKSASKTVAQNELDIKDLSLNNLEDARLNARLDSAYARPMTYPLSTVLALAQ